MLSAGVLCGSHKEGFSYPQPATGRSPPDHSPGETAERNPKRNIGYCQLPISLSQATVTVQVIWIDSLRTINTSTNRVYRVSGKS